MDPLRLEDENTRLANRWFEEVWNRRRVGTIDELLTESSVCRSESETIVGKAEFRDGYYAPMIAAFPDIRVKVEAIMARGDEVVVRWTATGTHLGDGLGFAATARGVAFVGMTWLICREGKLMEGWQVSNIGQSIRSLREPS